MAVQSVQNSPPSLPSAEMGTVDKGNREEAAIEFERILVKQFVDSMTENLFNDSLSGDDGPSWMSAYGDMQRDSLSDALTEHLVESGAMRLRDLLLRQWNHPAETPDSLQPDSDL